MERHARFTIAPSVERSADSLLSKHPPQRLFDAFEGLVVAGSILHHSAVAVALRDFISLAPFVPCSDGFTEHVLDVFPRPVIGPLHWLAHGFPIFRVAHHRCRSVVHDCSLFLVVRSTRVVSERSPIEIEVFVGSDFGDSSAD